MTVADRSRWAIAGVSAGVVFAVGYFIGGVVPGGGEVTAGDITDFYLGYSRELN
jgi:hypothetical protein